MWRRFRLWFKSLWYCNLNATNNNKNNGNKTIGKIECGDDGYALSFRLRFDSNYLINADIFMPNI